MPEFTVSLYISFTIEAKTNHEILARSAPAIRSEANGRYDVTEIGKEVRAGQIGQCVAPQLQ